MGFRVDEGGLQGMVEFSTRLGEDATASRRYFDNNTDINWTGEGLINILTGGHQSVQEHVSKYLGSINNPIATGLNEQLSGSLDYYRSTDDANEARLDEAYRGGDVGEAKQGTEPTNSNAPRFADLYTIEDFLKQVKDYNADFPYEPNWKDIISPSSLLRDAIWKVTEAGTSLGICDRPYDPFEVVLKPLIGDWAGMRACADVFENLGNALQAMGDNIQHAAEGTSEVWEGNAGSNAQAYLYNLSKPPRNCQQPLLDLAKEYKEAAQGAYDFSRTIGVLISDIADAAIAAAASAAITALAGSTGVGLPIALVVGAFTVSRIYKVVKAIRDVIDILVRLEALLNSVKATAGDFGLIESGGTLPTLPGGITGLPR